MSSYILLLRGGDETNEYSAEQYQQLLQRYFDWSAQLRRAGQLVSAEELKLGGRIVSADAVVDGPFTETKETIGGFYLIQAKDLDEATEIARGCPALTHGGVVELREAVVHE